MANCCIYALKITGETKENVEDLMKRLRKDEPYKKTGGVGRVWSFYPGEVEDDYDEFSIIGYGDCAWSVQCSMIDSKTNLVDLSKALDLNIEIYSEESSFQEHYIIKKGIVVLDDSVDFEEYFLYDMDPEEIQELATRLELSLEALKDKADENDGCITVGGYDEWDYDI